MSASIMVSRGDELPKHNLGKKLHPTYETIIRLKGVEKKYSSPHTVIKFFDDYRTLCQGLEKLGVGDGCVVPVANKFPPSHSASKLGFSMGEEALQQRCFLLNKWMGEVFRLYTTPGMPPAAQALFEQFLSLATNDDENSMTPDVMEHRAKILQIMKGDAATKATNTGIAAEVVSSTDSASGKAGNTKGSSAPKNNNANNSNSSSSNNNSSSSSANNDNNIRNHTGRNVSPLPGAPGSSLASSSNNNNNATNGNSNRPPSGRSFTPPPPSSNSIAPAQPPRSMTPPRSSMYGGISSRFSISSEMPPVSSPTRSEMEDYSKEQVVNHFLAVCVLRGEGFTSKSVIGTEGKTHASYDLIVRMLPYADVNVPNKGDIDEELYRNLFQFPPLVVTYNFAAFRDLRNDLESAGVSSTDSGHINPAALSLAQQTAAAGDQQPLTDIPIPFPRTFKRSSLGFQLSEEQLEVRMVMLNNWTGYVLNNFKRINPAGQALLMKFMGLKSSVETSAAAVARAERDNRNATDGTVSMHLLEMLGESHDVIIKVLSDTFIPPLTAMAAARLGQPQIAATDPVGAVLASEAKAAKLTRDDEAIKLGQETILNNMLSLHIEQGTYTKKNDTKPHTSYITTISILPLFRVPAECIPNRKGIDDQAYGRMLTGPGGASSWVAKPFDAYRTLKSNLEQLGVYCAEKESMTKAANDANAIFLDVPFPKTYTKSSLGISLTEAEKLDRKVVLNQWMGTVMGAFNRYPEKVQECLCRFLTLDAEDPSAPQQKIILEMLTGTFVFPMKPVPKDKTAAGKKGSAGTRTAGGVDNSSSGTDDGDGESNGGGNTEAVSTKGCCVVS